MIKVSVIIPVYNSENYLRQCIESVINQTLKEIEIICIDDGSTDNSLNILKEYAQIDNRIKIIEQVNSGAGKSRNVGIEIATGEYLYFLDSDDYLVVDALENLFNSIGKADICLCKSKLNNGLEEKVSEYSLKTKYFNKKKYISSKQIPEKIFKICAPALFTKLYKTSFIKRNNITCQEIKTCNDVYFNYSSLILASSITYIDEALVVHRINLQTSLTSNRGKSATCILVALNQLKALLEEKNLFKVFKKSFYKCAEKRFKYELKFCNDVQKEEMEKYIEVFLPQKFKLFGYKKNYQHNIITLFGLNIKIRKEINSKDIPALLKLWYFKKTGEILNLDNPQTFNEKIQWLKLYDSTPLKTQLADKYLVREWVKEKIGEEYLIPLLGVWDKFEDIDFDKLPNQFVLKANHGCAWNIIVKNKNQFNKVSAKKKFKKWLAINFAFCEGLQLHYKDIKPKIIAEKYLEEKNGELSDYKILCFNGVPKFIWIDQGRFSQRTENIYNIDWELQPFRLTYENSKEEVPKPKNLEKMIELAKILSKDFVQVRVDFYNVNEKIYFGEMTFTSANGIDKFIPNSWNYKLGQMLKLPDKKA